MKVDVQGSEVRLFGGAARLLAACAIKRIKSEMAFVWLRGAGTSAAQYCALLRANGFVLTDEANAALGPDMCAEAGSSLGGAPDFLGILDEAECARLHPARHGA